MRMVFQRRARSGLRAFLAAAVLSAGTLCVCAQEAEGVDTGVVLGDADLAERAEIARNLFRRITPGDGELVQDAGTWPAAWEEFWAAWDGAAAEREFGAWVVPVAVSQEDGATVVRDADGEVLWRGTTDFAKPESAGVVLTGALVGEEEWAGYEAVREAVEELETAGGTPAPPVRGGVTNGLRFTSVAVGTNGTVELALAWEEDGEVDVFAYGPLHETVTNVATWTNDENAVVTSTNVSWHAVEPGLAGFGNAWEWVGTVAVSNGAAALADAGFPPERGKVRFYAAAPAVDTDGDGLNDGFEDFVSHSNSASADTDGDGLSDGEEVQGGLDPNDSDTDGDGLPDGWEVWNGLDALSASGADGPDGDPDGDGFPNALERVLGGMANNPAWSDGQLAYRLCHLQNGDAEPGLRVDVEDSQNCGGTNNQRQNVAATLAVPGLMSWGVFLDVTVEGSVEDQNSGYDVVTVEAFTNTFFFEGNENHHACQMADKSATCRVLVLPNSQVRLRYDTVGRLYHTGAFAAITAVSVAGAIGSETVSEWPPNRWRTVLGVGEEVDLKFPADMGFAVWTRAGETTPLGTGAVVRYSAPDTAGTEEVSVSFDGHVLSRTFQVVEPTGVVSAAIRGVKRAPPGYPGAGMHLYPIVVGPTNVSFYKVKCQEVGRPATNCTGWWAIHGAPSHAVSGADEWFSVDQHNRFPTDKAELLGNLPWSAQPFGPGHFEWDIPARWKVGDTGTEHSMTGWKQEFDVETNGTVTIHKFGKWVRRTLFDRIDHN